MLVANSFDLWQKDTFFPAAEEVQQSADIMESAYRTWLRGRRDGLIPQHLDELGRELQMALGTAKWQLEEFEKAVRLSYKNHGDDITITRHRQFVSAIEDQISGIEAAFKESFNMDGRKRFQWVNLDEEECDDLALFLSGTPGTSQKVKVEGIQHGSVVTSPLNMKYYTKEDNSLGSEVSFKLLIPNQGKHLEDAITSNKGSNSSIELQKSEFLAMRDEISCQVNRVTNICKTWSSPERNTLEIVVDGGNKQNIAMIEETPKEKASKPFFWRSRCKGRPRAKGGVLSRTHLKMIDQMNQFEGRLRSQRQQQVLPLLPVNSVRFILALMLTIFLVGMVFLSLLTSTDNKLVKMVISFQFASFFSCFGHDCTAVTDGFFYNVVLETSTLRCVAVIHIIHA